MMRRTGKTRRRPARKRRGTRTRSLRTRLGRIGLHVTLWIGLAALVAVVQVDRKVVARFESMRWDTPATIRFAPLTLTVGGHLDRGFLERHLVALGYRATSDPSRAGTFRLRPGGIDLRPRGDRAQTVSVGFLDGRVVELTGGDGVALRSLKLEPATIGSLYPSHAQVRYPVAAEDVPALLVRALLVTEDRRFFRHFGVDAVGIARAAFQNLAAGHTVAGGSTLTQQLAKSMFLSSERTLTRKARELVIALILEARYDKRELLEAYVNLVYLGQSGQYAIHGFGSAARHYFGRPLSELDAGETALLVGLLKGASYYNPWRHPERARERRNLVLAEMGDAGVLDPAVVERHQRAPLRIRSSPKVPEHVDLKRLVSAGLKGRVDDAVLRRAGMWIDTTIDPYVQHAAERALATSIADLDADNPGHVVQGAIVVVDYRTGALEALVAGRSDERNEFNRSTMARRNVGSLIKPLLYQAWFENYPERHPFTRIRDEAVSVPVGGGRPEWRPQNYDRREHGQVTVAEALSKSYNLAAVGLGLEIGTRELSRFLKRAGIARSLGPLPPAALLGAVSLSPVEVAAAYQTLANEGRHLPMHVVAGLVLPDGRAARGGLKAAELKMNPEAVVKTRYLMTRVTLDGTASVIAREGRPWPVAGKTGTTDETRDSWFAGFDGRRLTVVWIGRDDHRPIQGRAGNRALATWLEFTAAVGSEPLPMLRDERLAWFAAKSAVGRARECRYVDAFPSTSRRAPPGMAPCATVVPPR